MAADPGGSWALARTHVRSALGGEPSAPAEAPALAAFGAVHSGAIARALTPEQDPRTEAHLMTEALVVLVTTPTADKAAEIARVLVEERLAACGNVIPGLRSMYRWQGRVQDDAEALLLLKTTRERFPSLRDRVLALHPYEVPEVVAVPVTEASDAYLAWILSETKPG